MNTRITVSVVDYLTAGETRLGEFGAVITEVEGIAYLTGYPQFDYKDYRSLSTGDRWFVGVGYVGTGTTSSRAGSSLVRRG